MPLLLYRETPMRVEFAQNTVSKHEPINILGVNLGYTINTKVAFFASHLVIQFECVHCCIPWYMIWIGTRSPVPDVPRIYTCT